MKATVCRLSGSFVPTAGDVHHEGPLLRLHEDASSLGAESSSVVVVKHISGIKGLVRIRPPATMTGPTTALAHSV
ncbi:hypothetical protein EYF80_012301 [Liparis tanakae]|uniref:Uncharacterized protein n=1 Tax=Liparis tanakae TaxID=230148 RepID=A0A4Z2II87_9TELE|nr:hypothetical protein EYF80_012301 [Liparis tanakae]